MKIEKNSGKILDLTVKSCMCKAGEKWAGKEYSLKYEIHHHRRDAR